MRGNAILAATLAGTVAVCGLCGFGAATLWSGHEADRLADDANDAQENGDLEQAAGLLRETLEHDEADARRWNGLGWVLARMGRQAEAVAAYDHALALDADNGYAAYGRAFALEALGRHDDALEWFGRAIALGYEVGEMQANRARVLADAGRLEEAGAAADAARAAHIDRAPVWNSVGRVMRKLGRPDDATEAFTRALEIDPGYAWARFNRGLTLGEAGRHAEALPDWDASIAGGHRVGEAHYERGKAYTELGRYDEALADFEQARATGDEPSRDWAETGDVLVAQGKDEEAVAAYQAAVAINPTFAEALRELGETLRRLGRTDEALAALTGAIEHGERPTKALIERARLYMDDLDDGEAAARDLNRASELDPDDYYVHTNLGWAQESYEDWQNAFANYDAALALRTDEPWTFGARGRMHLELGRPAEAIEDFATAVRMAPADSSHLLGPWREASKALPDTADDEPDLRLVQAELSVLRGLPFLHDVPSATQKAEEFGSLVGESIDAHSTPEERHDQLRGLRRLGLMHAPRSGGGEAAPEKDVDLRDAVSHALQTQAAAYYDPDEETFFYIAEGMPFDMLESVAAHELVHALQDQQKGLREFQSRAMRRPRGAPRNDDRVFACRSVTEGEATFLQMAWQMVRTRDAEPDWALGMAKLGVGLVSNMDTPSLITMLRRMSEKLPDEHPMKQSLEQSDSIPTYVLAPFLGAYFKGAGLCSYQFSTHGWAGIDALYERPPESAEQVLHPLLYDKKRDRPTPVDTPDLGNVEAAGWERCDAAVHGELYLSLLLTENGVKPLTARRAAAGWDGDVYVAYSRDDRTAIALVTTWDTEKDAAEFAAAYVEALAGKYAAQVPDGLETRKLDDGSLTQGPLARPDDAVLVRTRGREVLIAEGWDAQLAAQVMQRLERLPIDHVD